MKNIWKLLDTLINVGDTKGLVSSEFRQAYEALSQEYRSFRTNAISRDQSNHEVRSESIHPKRPRSLSEP
jgi:hypothetical protein